MIPVILFWFSAGMIFYSYIIFPWIMRRVSMRKKDNVIIYTPEEKLPYISVIMSVYNEEAVIKNKIGSIYYTHYPLNKFEVLIGSDASSDNTDLICRLYSENYENLKFFPFTKRRGKPSIVNDLAQHARGEILIITDANVMFECNTLFELIKHFRNENIGLVDSHMKHTELRKQGISIQENAYISREVKIKHDESISWGCMMGPFGGCYAVRKELYEPVPENFLVDDFYINMKVLSKDRKAINSMEAVVREDVSDDLSEEFRRKIRIAAGNYQNLSAFKKMLLRPFTPVAFCLFSHKILRWLGPVFFITALISSLMLADRNFYKFVILLEAMIILAPLVDFLLKKIKIHVVFLRFITHFLTMNLALILGFIRFIGGIKTNIWQPTRRKQSEGY